MSKKIIIGVIIIMSISLFGALASGCDGGKSIDFTLALGRMDYGIDPEIYGAEDSQIEKLVSSYTEWVEMDSVKKLPEIDDKYQKEFFDENALVVCAFETPTRGGTIDKIKVSVKNSELRLRMSYSDGIANAMSFGIVVIEIKKVDISDVTKLVVEKNL